MSIDPRERFPNRRKACLRAALCMAGAGLALNGSGGSVGLAQVRPPIMRPRLQRGLPLTPPAPLQLVRPPVSIELGEIRRTVPFTLRPDAPGVDVDLQLASTQRVSVDIKWQGPARLRAVLTDPARSRESDSGTNPGAGADRTVTVEGVSPLRLQMSLAPAGESGRALVWLERLRREPRSRLLSTLQSRLAQPVHGAMTMRYAASFRARPSPFVGWFLASARAAIEQRSADPSWRQALQRAPAVRNALAPALELFAAMSPSQRQELFGGSTSIDDAIRTHLRWASEEAERRAQAPRIERIVPAKPVAGQALAVQGINLADAQGNSGLLLYRMATTGARQVVQLDSGVNLFRVGPYVVIDTSRFRRASGPEPAPLTPGRYGLTVITRYGTDEIAFDLRDPERIAAQRRVYTGRIERVVCDDESNPESLLIIKNLTDEVFATVSLTRIAGDSSSTATLNTPTRGGFDDHVTKDVEWPLLGRIQNHTIGDTPTTLGDGVVLTVVLWEDDAGPPPARVRETIDFVAQRAAAELLSDGAIAAMGLTGASGAVVAVVAAYIASEIVTAVVDWIWSALEDDYLGSGTVALDPVALMQALEAGRGTAASTGPVADPECSPVPRVGPSGNSLAGCLRYDNDSDTGSYRLFFTLRPEQVR